MEKKVKPKIEKKLKGSRVNRVGWGKWEEKKQKTKKEEKLKGRGKCRKRFEFGKTTELMAGRKCPFPH